MEGQVEVPENVLETLVEAGAVNRKRDDDCRFTP